jgi:excisionase family DNA binding protein
MRKINDIFYYTPKEACEVLSIRRETLNNARRNKRLPFNCIEFMNRYLYHKEEVDQYIKKSTIDLNSKDSHAG